MGEIEQLKEDLDDLTNVEDAEEDVSTSGDLFSISSFGVDYPVEMNVACGSNFPLGSSFRRRKV